MASAWASSVIALAALATALSPSRAAAESASPVQKTAELPENGRIYFAADEIVYDRELERVTATGHVTVTRNGQSVDAESVVYAMRSGRVTATGRVRFKDLSGNVLRANVVELSDDLRDGFVESVHVIFTDGSRAAAIEARREEGSITRLTRAVYSPCEICDDDPDRPPLWQIKARKAIHDAEKHSMTYHDAFLEFFGVPVAYTPWFRHTDPSVKRKSGFLTPDIGRSTQLGFNARVPYYFNLSPNKDFTFEPLITTRGGVLLAGEYRHMIKSGQFSLDGSFTRVERVDENGEPIGGQRTRGHIHGTGQFRLTDSSRWGFDAGWTTDDTFLRRYGINQADTLTSRLFYERFDGRSYGEVNAYSFQGFRAEDISGETPFILPSAAYHYVSEPGFWNSFYSVDADFLILQRTSGPDTRRASLSAKWEVPYTSPFGDIYRFSVSLRGDLYHTSGFVPATDPKDMTNQDFDSRVLPRVALDWRYPFIRRGENSWQILEPIVAIVASPNGGNPVNIPNEDSLSFELDTVNLFDTDRFAGLDRWDGGQRIAYGLRYEYHHFGGASGSVLVGQNYRLTRNTAFSVDSGLAHRFSDYVVEADISLPPYIDYVHRLRFDRRTLEVKRNEINVLTEISSAVRLQFGYLDLVRDDSESEFQDRREINAAGQFALSKEWSVASSIIRDIGENAGTIKGGVSLTYSDECITFRTSFRRDFTRDRDIAPSTSINFRIVFKHLGL